MADMNVEKLVKELENVQNTNGDLFDELAIILHDTYQMVTSYGKNKNKVQDREKMQREADDLLKQIAYYTVSVIKFKYGLIDE